MKRTTAFLMAVVLLLSMTGCGQKETPVPVAGTGVKHPGEPTDVEMKQSVNLTEEIEKGDIEPLEDLRESSNVLADFSVGLLQNSLEEENNTLISPMSVLYALAMAANGANGETLRQMESVLGLPVDDLNMWLYSYLACLQETDLQKLRLANTIWFRDDPGFTVDEAFLQKVADYYNTDIFRAPFDEATCNEINAWVERKTSGMVKNILDEIPADAILYLVNALAFESKWMDPYWDVQVRKSVFTTEIGTKQQTELMYSEEMLYLEDGLATGFIKHYENGRYGFAALLPNEGVTVAEYIRQLTGENLCQMLADPQVIKVDAGLPKFETEFQTEMSDVLAAMGTTDAFEPAVSDFSRMGTCREGNIVINRVLHKTFISVAEQGTRAGAATVVEAAPGAAPPGEPEERKIVILDRPFVYMIVDLQTGLPLFMGTVLSVDGPVSAAGDHNHKPAEEPAMCDEPVIAGYNSDLRALIQKDGEVYPVMHHDALELTDLLLNLAYDPDGVCSCMADFTVDTEYETGFQVSLSQAFVRCERGQVPLTAEQIQFIQERIGNP